jgi:outer membrane protein assembly factor BamB
MTRCRRPTVLLATLLACSPLAAAGDWPQWRGPTADSVSTETGLPLRWSENQGVAWKCPLPDGASTPAIRGDAIFVTGQDGERLLLSRIDKATGKVVWTQQVGSGRVERTAPPRRADAQRPRQKFHGLHNLASPSPLTDGELVIAHFGNGDLAAHDYAGKQLWKRNLQQEHGPYTIWWGHANSPVLYRDLVICACMQDSLTDLNLPRSESYLAAYDKRTGEPRWKTLRPTQATAEQCDAYTTPLLRRSADGTDELIVMGGRQLDAYDPLTGKQRWALTGLAGNRTITGPTLADGLVYATVGMRGPLLAVRPGEAGRPPETVWQHTQSTPDSPCPVVVNGLVFLVSDDGFAQCLDAKTGKQHWRERLRGDHKASPLTAEGRVYFLSLKGVCTVVAAEPMFRKLAENQLDDELVASPAVSDGRLFLRGRKALYCISGRQ